MTCIVRHRPLHYYCINALCTLSSALEQEADFQMVLCSVFSQAGFDPVLPDIQGVHYVLHSALQALGSRLDLLPG